ncbi:MAG: hypothetical protein LIO96_14940 [Lachnospiraceae bacterium]|nr:hypothetical protein [Lachnospiraceae bacterium]
MRFKKIISIVACAGFIAAVLPASILAETSSEIQEEIDDYKSDLAESEEESEDLESRITDLQSQVGDLYSEIQTLNIQKQEYIESMSARIVYFYKNESNNQIMDALLVSDSFSDILNIVSQQKALHDYDSAKLQEYQDIIAETEEKQSEMDAQVEELCVLLEEEEALQEELEAKISKKEEDLEEAKKAEEEARKAEEEAKKAEEAAERSSAGSADSAFNYAMSSSGGVLTKSKGVVYYNGHRETCYSQRVLPGTGLNIPGRHVDSSDGTVRDGDGYICVASSDLPKGTIVETSLGIGKVYDCGCESGIIDIYTDW